MSKKRRTFSRDFKAKIALEALQENLTISQLSKKYGIHSNQISTWKKQAKEDLPEVFGSAKKDDEQDKLISTLYEKIGRLEVELDWLKKKSDIFKK